MDQIEEMAKQQDKMCEKLQKAEEAKQACHSAGCREEKTKQVQKETEQPLKERDSAQSPWQNLRKIAINEFEPPETKPQEEKSEFDLDGAKKVLAKYTKMNLDNLMGLSAVDPKCREYIAKNVFFEIKHLYKFDEVAFTQQRIAEAGGDGTERVITVPNPKNSNPVQHPEFFSMLYGWGQYYLQCYPKKSAAFLEYLQFLTKYGVMYSVLTLIRLDNQICQYFIQHSDMQWDTTSPFIQRVLLDIGIEVQKGILQALPTQVTLVSPQPQRDNQSQAGNHNNQSQNCSGSGHSHHHGGGGCQCEWSDNCDR